MSVWDVLLTRNSRSAQYSPSRTKVSLQIEEMRKELERHRDHPAVMYHTMVKLLALLEEVADGRYPIE